jgi:hypothetical protein
MKRTVQLRVAFSLTVLVVLSAGTPPAAAQDRPAVQLDGPLSARGGTVTGTAWRSDNTPLADAQLQLRDISTGRIVSSTRADDLGRFTFTKVNPGTYVVELVDGNRRVLAVGETFSVGPTDTVATSVRLAAPGRWHGGIFTNAAAAAIAVAAIVGVTALGNGGQPASPRF